MKLVQYNPEKSVSAFLQGESELPEVVCDKCYDNEALASDEGEQYCSKCYEEEVL